ncbi:MAG: c-type cytochrome [Acidobacteriota bacterium]|nr:c-type cytochrome [Acidobacteriota bacterium]
MKRLPILLLTVALACRETPAAQQPPQPPPVPGDAARGKQLIAQYACNVCHAVPGTEGMQGVLAPSLAGLASRPSISNGAVQNTPANIRQFIRSPATLNPQTAMPPIEMPEADARDLTAFLMTLR